jgi:hypothetical protein
MVPILGELATGLAAELLKGGLQHHARRLHGTRVGKALSAAGLLEPDFEAKLQRGIQSAILSFFDAHEEHRDARIIKFLGEPYVAGFSQPWHLAALSE